PRPAGRLATAGAIAGAAPAGLALMTQLRMEAGRIARLRQAARPHGMLHLLSPSSILFWAL
ncbi:MAG: hypothetical protein ABWY05_00790, partial [Noviherbaspirillum sp.]